MKKNKEKEALKEKFMAQLRANIKRKIQLQKVEKEIEELEQIVKTIGKK